MHTIQTYYQREIAKFVPSDIDPRHIEAFMRLNYSTLSNLSKRTFNREIKIGIACIQQGGVDGAEKLALSFGL